MNRRQRLCSCLILVCVALSLASACSAQETSAMRSRTAFQQIEPDLFVWTDTCNVYVLKDGDAALLVDLGDGSVLEHLKDIGVARVEWVLFTHHHREQCQGFPKLRSMGVPPMPTGETPVLPNPYSRIVDPISSAEIWPRGRITPCSETNPLPPSAWLCNFALHESGSV